MRPPELHGPTGSKLTLCSGATGQDGIGAKRHAVLAQPLDVLHRGHRLQRGHGPNGDRAFRRFAPYSPEMVRPGIVLFDAWDQSPAVQGLLHECWPCYSPAPRSPIALT